MQTTTELTNEYIKEHPHIKSCLKKDLINYSSLARLISKELHIEKKTSKEAILIAARRFKDKLNKELSNERQVKEILRNSEIEIKNKITRYVYSKEINFDIIEKLQKKVKEENGTFFIIEGSNSYTIIIQDKYVSLLKQKIQAKVIQSQDSLALVNVKSSEKIVKEIGVISFLTSLFAENGVNITDLLSCWQDNLFIISSKDVNKVINFLEF